MKNLFNILIKILKNQLVINNKLLEINVIGYKFNHLVINILVFHNYVYNLVQVLIIAMELKFNLNYVFCFQIINVHHVIKFLILVLVWTWEIIVFIIQKVDVNQIYVNIWIRLNVNNLMTDVHTLITNANKNVINYKLNNANKEILIAIGILIHKCVKKE